jgi:tetratricopeptide (TPR) repeat protein
MLILGAGTVSAQAELSEPVFAETAELPGFLFPAVDSAYLWAFNPGDASEFVDFTALAVVAAAADTDAVQVIPGSIRNNRYYLESLRLTRLAQENYEYGDYDKSSDYAAEALEYAQRSDEYVALQLKIKETNDAIATARSRFDWASSVGAARRYPSEYGQAQTYYNQALSFRTAERWDDAIDAAHRVINALANVTAAVAENPDPPPVNVNDGTLPAQYTVRPWAVSRDCLWNIAGRPWAYGDPAKWRLLYDANKTKLPDPNNPNLIHPGMILDIPSINGEIRRGMWDAGRTYNPLR